MIVKWLNIFVVEIILKCIGVRNVIIIWDIKIIVVHIIRECICIIHWHFIRGDYFIIIHNIWVLN